MTSPLQTIDAGAYHWAAISNEHKDPETDTGRVLTVAWVAPARHTGAPSVLSLIRELSYDQVPRN